MRRSTLTLSLFGLAAVAAAVAPRLIGAGGDDAHPIHALPGSHLEPAAVVPPIPVTRPQAIPELAEPPTIPELSVPRPAPARIPELSEPPRPPAVVLPPPPAVDPDWDGCPACGRG